MAACTEPNRHTTQQDDAEELLGAQLKTTANLKLSLDATIRQAAQQELTAGAARAPIVPLAPSAAVLKRGDRDEVRNSIKNAFGGHEHQGAAGLWQRISSLA